MALATNSDNNQDRRVSQTWPRSSHTRTTTKICPPFGHALTAIRPRGAASTTPGPPRGDTRSVSGGPPPRGPEVRRARGHRRLGLGGDQALELNASDGSLLSSRLRLTVTVCFGVLPYSQGKTSDHSRLPQGPAWSGQGVLCGNSRPVLCTAASFVCTILSLSLCATTQ